MKKYDVISLDMFQTLVNVDTRKNEIWKAILKDEFTQAKSIDYGKELLEIVQANMRKNNGFTTLREIFTSSFEHHFTANTISFSSSEAAIIIMNEHAQAEMYEDTLDFLDYISGRYQISIVSDADDTMIPLTFRRNPYIVMTSEQHRSYKNDQSNMMFKTLLNTIQLEPHRILHIGDSASDILGARREGISTCWLNRDNRSWKQENKPDFIVSSLEELKSIL
ncbi:MAG: HAD family hydrolase [Gorillibacterium sp.]|nr:HAD family hydrolase [Gorillibacterium sp.]